MATAPRPKFRIELPDDPILGDGKSDNQNHAIIFYRGEYLQLIDANQDNYLEECLKIRNVLAEFEEFVVPNQRPYGQWNYKDFRNPPVAIVGDVLDWKLNCTMDTPISSTLYSRLLVVVFPRLKKGCILMKIHLCGYGCFRTRWQDQAHRVLNAGRDAILGLVLSSISRRNLEQAWLSICSAVNIITLAPSY